MQKSLYLSQFIKHFLFDKQSGYYARSSHFLGREGDFVTAPHMTSLFGEILALVYVAHFQSFLEKEKALPIVIMELGGGDGLLMEDMLRTWKCFPFFYNRLQSIVSIEKSHWCRQEQKKRWGKYNIKTKWLDNLNDFTNLEDPVFLCVIGNEFLDALAVEHYIWTGSVWVPRYVVHNGIDWAFEAHYETCDIMESSFEVFECIKTLNKLLQRYPGLVLLIDYGDLSGEVRLGSTIQAVRKSKRVPIFSSPGEADISAHVDFSFLRFLCASCLKVHVYAQNEFLRLWGLEERLKHTQVANNPDIWRAVGRLIAPHEMGVLFKVLYISSQSDFP